MNYSPNGAPPSSIPELVVQLRNNFLVRDCELMDNFKFNQYKTLRRIHLYLNNEFESGPFDSQGNQKYFYNLCNFRNDQATKNIDMDSKDVEITGKMSSDFAKSFFLRAEWEQFAKKEQIGKLLNQLSEDLPRYGSVVWKRMRKDGKVKIYDVDLRNLINDPTAFCLKDSPVVERHTMSAVEMRAMEAWDQVEVEKYLKATTGTPVQPFMENNGQSIPMAYSVVDMIPEFAVYEIWGWLPENLLPKSIMGNAEPKPNGLRYVMAVVSGVDQGGTPTLFYAKEVDPKMFPYGEIHYRRVKGRWLGQGNVERLFPLQQRANELINRYYRSLRLGTIHLFQTRDRLAVRNVLTDAEDGDIIEVKSEISPIETSLRSFPQLQSELQTIEAQADRECNTPETVTGEALPTNTPFRLGALQGQSAAKMYVFIRQNIGLFLEFIINEWLLPDFAKSLTEEHILEILGTVDEVEKFDQALMTSKLYESYKKYVIENGKLPSQEEMDVFKGAVLEQIKNSKRTSMIPSGYFEEQDYHIVVNTVNENHNKPAILESLTNVFQVIATNPQALQDPRVSTVFNKILEESHAMSPVLLASLTGGKSSPTLDSAMTGSPAAPSPLPQGAPAAQPVAA